MRTAMMPTASVAPPLCKLSVERLPRAPAQDLASAPTFSRLEHSVDRKDLYRLAQALVAHCVASYPEPPAAIRLGHFVVTF